MVLGGARQKGGCPVKKRMISVFLAAFFLAAAPGDASAFWPFDRPQPQAPPAPAPVYKGLTLEAAYKLALKRSETVAMSRSEIEEARGRFYQGLTYILPDVHFVMTRFDQEAGYHGTGEGESSSSGGEGASANALRPSIPLKKFTFHQPLFSGFKEFAALTGGGADRKSQEFKYQRAKELLWLDVSDSFYTLLQAREDLKVLQEAHDSMAQRLEDLNERMKVGRSRTSEVQSSTADQKLIDAELAAARRIEKTTRELFEFYIGQPLIEELDDALDLGAEISNSLYYVGRSARRSDVMAAEQDYVLAQKKVISAQAGFFPSIYLDGNYYTHRTGFTSGIDWDTTLTFDVPIFDGMDTIGKVRESASQKDQARFAFEKSRRMAALEAQQQFDSYETRLEEEKYYREAKDAARESYRLQTEDYRHNLVNNLEVLDSLRRYQDISRGWTSALYEAKKEYWALKVSAGDLEAKL